MIHLSEMIRTFAKPKGNEWQARQVERRRWAKVEINEAEAGFDINASTVRLGLHLRFVVETRDEGVRAYRLSIF